MDLFGDTEYVADVNFRAEVVCVRSSSGYNSGRRHNSHLLSSVEEAFTYAVRFFTEQDGFDGITIAGMSLFMENVDLSQVYATPHSGKDIKIEPSP